LLADDGRPWDRREQLKLAGAEITVAVRR